MLTSIHTCSLLRLLMRLFNLPVRSPYSKLGEDRFGSRDCDVGRHLLDSNVRDFVVLSDDRKALQAETALSGFQKTQAAVATHTLERGEPRRGDASKRRPRFARKTPLSSARNRTAGGMRVYQWTKLGINACHGRSVRVPFGASFSFHALRISQYQQSM